MVETEQENFEGQFESNVSIIIKAKSSLHNLKQANKKMDRFSLKGMPGYFPLSKPPEYLLHALEQD